MIVSNYFFIKRIAKYYQNLKNSLKLKCLMMFIIHHLFQYKSWKQSFNCVENAFGFDVLNNSIETEIYMEMGNSSKTMLQHFEYNQNFHNQRNYFDIFRSFVSM